MSDYLMFMSNVKTYIDNLEHENRLLKRKLFISDFVYGEILQKRFSDPRNKSRGNEIKFDKSFIKNIISLYDGNNEEQNKYLYEIMNRFSDTVFEYLRHLVLKIINEEYKYCEKTITDLISEESIMNTKNITIEHIRIILKFINHMYDNKESIIRSELFSFYPELIKSSNAEDPLKDVHYIVDCNKHFHSIRKLICSTFHEFIQLLPKQEKKHKARELLNIVMNTSVSKLSSILYPDLDTEEHD